MKVSNMSIIQSLAKIKQSRSNASRNTARDIDLTKDDESPTLSTDMQLSHSETGLGILDFESSREAASRANEKQLRGKYTVYSDSKRFAIGKSASENTTASTLRRLKNEFTDLSEA